MWENDSLLQVWFDSQTSHYQTENKFPRSTWPALPYSQATEEQTRENQQNLTATDNVPNPEISHLYLPSLVGKQCPQII